MNKEMNKGMKKDFYAILGVSKTATEEEIKKAYNRLVLKYHPDRHKNKSEKEMKEVTAKFMEVKEAYDVLSDKVKRAEYDRYGRVGGQFNNSNFKDFNFKDFRNFGDFNFGDFSFGDFNFGDFNFGDFGKKFKTAGFNFDSNFSNFKNVKTDPFEEIFSQKNNSPTQYVLRLTLSELFTGCTKKVKIIRNRFGRREEKILEIKISPGEKSGTKFRFKGEGDRIKNNFNFGNFSNFSNFSNLSNNFNDLIVVIEEIPDKIFKRKGNDLEVKIRITLRDLVRGFNTALNLPGNRVYNVTHRDVKKVGDWNRVPGMGMVGKNGDVGDLMIFFSMDVPLIEDYKRDGMARYL